MRALAALALVTASLALWVTLVRPWMRDRPWAAGFFRLIEPVERWVYDKSESILWARFLQVAGLLVPLLQFIGTIDLRAWQDLIPDGWGPYLFLAVFLAGVIGEWLRRDTTRPLELVALPPSAPPEAHEAAAMADDMNKMAVEVVREVAPTTPAGGSDGTA